MKMRSLGDSLTQYDWCSSKGGMPCDKRQTQIECHVMNEAVTRVYSSKQRNTKAQWLLPKARRKQERILLGNLPGREARKMVAI